jgi:hypothetical protein
MTSADRIDEQHAHIRLCAWMLPPAFGHRAAALKNVFGGFPW